MSGSSQHPSKAWSAYKKLLPDGTLDKRPFVQSDYDTVVQYIKKSFPKATTLQRDIDQTLKRTFVLGKTELKNKSFTQPMKMSQKSANRKARIKKQKAVPKVLPYQHFVQLNALWKDYVADLLKNSNNAEDIQLKLNRIDLHGAFIKVVEGNCEDFTGISGIVIKETRNTFVLVTSTNATKTVPKTENVFDIKLKEPEGTMRIAGNSFITRPAERASKKIKSFMEFVGSKVYKSKLRYS